MDLTLKTPDEKEFKKVCEFVKEFELDNRDLKKEQFIIALFNNEIAGFCRLREHTDCLEMCTLGVIIKQRGKEIGKTIITKLIEKATRDIYLVCIIPDYFKSFGFKIVNDYPESILNKMEYCTNELEVPETYVAMMRKK